MIKLVSLLIVMLLSSLACNLGSGSNADQADGNSSESSNADTGDANSGGGEDDPGDSQPEPEDNVAETIDLGTVNQLSDVHPNYINNAVAIYEGVSTDGSQVSFQFILRVETQTEPFEAYYTLMSETINGEEESIQVVTLEGNNYTTFPDGICLVSSLAGTAENIYEMSIEPFDAFQNESTLIQKGVTVNGVLSDEYTLSEENFLAGSMETFDFIDGSIFIARDGGYVTRVHVTAVAHSYGSFISFDANAAGFDSNTEVLSEITADYFPVDSFEHFVPPENCSSD